MESSRSTPARSTCAPRPAKAHPSGSNSPLRGKRFMSKGSILVVDDEAEIREGLEFLLKSEDYSVATAEDGAGGLSRLEEHPFDLMLLDVNLPDANGIELLREVPKRSPGLPV